MTITINNYEDHRNVTIEAGQAFEIKIDGEVVYSHTITTGKKGNIAFQLQEVDEEVTE